MRKTPNSPGEKIVKDIKRATRKHYSSEEKIRIVLDGLRGEDSIAELCRREGIAQGIYYKWSKDFMEAGKKRLAVTQRYIEGDGEARMKVVEILSSRRPLMERANLLLRHPLVVEEILWTKCLMQHLY